MTTDQKIIFDTLYAKYNKMSLSKKEMAGETGLSTSTLDRLRKAGLGCAYIKQGKGDIFYPLLECAKYYCQSIIKTA